MNCYLMWKTIEERKDFIVRIRINRIIFSSENILQHYFENSKIL